ncbi:MAG: M20 family metallopeptidase [Bacteroidota bacterium]
MKEKIKQLAEKYLPEVIQIRRHLHANPELSFEEYNTSKFIASKLKEFGIPYKEKIAKTGIVATIIGTQSSSLNGKKENRLCIALRADMDALPITEANEVEYKSKTPGVMHACGHDAHIASLLGAAKILNEIKNTSSSLLGAEFRGTIKLIFQPGEEKSPGGASLMIKEGVLDNPAPLSIFAQHVFPSLEVGKVGFCNGKYLASADEIYLTVKGKGGHAAIVKSYINPLLIASEILLKLHQTFMKQETIPTVLAFGKIIGNGATNVIPDEVKIEGTFRTMDEKWRKEAHSIIRQICISTAHSMDGECEINIMSGYPALVNDENITTNAKNYAEEFLGKENVVTLEPRMASEDFSFFAQKIPACFYRLGTGNKSKGIISGVHTPTFNIDESALQTGMGLMAWIAMKEL